MWVKLERLLGDVQLAVERLVHGFTSLAVAPLDFDELFNPVIRLPLSQLPVVRVVTGAVRG